jgi:Spondin_N
MNRRAIVFRTALAALALGGVAAAVWATLAPRGDVVAAAPSRASDCRAPEAAASYRVTFVSTWSAQTHPESFPADAHYSGLHGATHHAGWSLWHSGGMATPGIERMAERGKSSPLKDEIREAVRAGHAGAEIRGDNLKRSPGSLGVDFRISREYPLVSLVAMLAPSPDWFVGVSALDLCEGGRWAAERTVELFAYDAGTDSGPSYKSPDADTQPREPIRRIETPPFRVGGALRAVGTLTFSRT